MTKRILIPFIVIFFAITIGLNFLNIEGQQFSYLANSFLYGKTYFLEEPGSWVDTVYFNGEHYWPGGPFPTMLLAPFVYLFAVFDLFFYQGYLQFFLVLGVFLLVHRIALRLEYNKTDSLYLAFAFCFATVFVDVALWSESWGFTQVVATLLLFLLILAYLKKYSLWLTGTLLGFLSMTRIAASGAILFFSLVIIKEGKKKKTLYKKLFSLFLPLLIFLVLVGLYNHVRFGDFLEQGYRRQIVSNISLAKAREHGVVGLIHIPGNLYYFLLSGPLPVFRDEVSHVLKFPFVRSNPWGMGIFITSPIFFYLFLLSYKDRLSKILIFTILATAFPIFLYYGIGWRQFGYRYSLDFLPFLFFLLIRNYKLRYKRLSRGFKFLILLSSITNFYFFLTAFLYY